MHLHTACPVPIAPGIFPKPNRLKEWPQTEDEKIYTIMHMVWRRTGISPAMMLKRPNKKANVAARQIVIYLCAEWKIAFHRTIAKKTGGGDTSTISFARKQVENRIFSDPSCKWIEQVRKAGYHNLLSF